MARKVFFWGLIHILLLQIGRGQDIFLVIQDQVDLTYIENALIKGKNKRGKEIFRLSSGKGGKVAIEQQSFSTINTLEIKHEGYKELKISTAELLAQQYRIYLESKTYNFNEIVFTANKYKENEEDIPYQIDLIKAQDIQFNNPQTSADLLSQKGSVFVQKSQMGGGSPNLRGFEANKVLIVVDGVRMNNAIFRSGHLQNVITIDPSVIDRAEIMFGPSSVMYGSDALGGVMHFYTKNPILSNTDKPLIKSNITTRYSSANQEKYVHGDLSFGTKTWGMLTSVSAVDYGNLRIGSNRNEKYPQWGNRDWYVDRVGGRDSLLINDQPDLMRFSAYKQLDILQKFYFLPSNYISHNFNFQYSTSSNIPRFDRLTQWRDRAPRFAEWEYGPQKRLMASYQLKHLYKNPYYDQLSFIAAYQDIEESRISRNFGSDERNHRIESLQVFSLNVDANKVVGYGHELAYGLEAIINPVSSTAFRENIRQGFRAKLDTRYPDGGSSMNTLAAYFTHRWEVNEKFTLTDGIRFTGVSLESRFEDSSFFPFPFSEIQQKNQAFSGNLAGVFRPSKGWRISLLAATAFRAPNLDDVAKVFDSQPGNVVVPNPSLKPEYSYNGELSISKTFGDILRIELTGFYTYYTNAIVVRDFNLNGEEFVVYEDSLSRVQANVNAKTALITGLNQNIFFELGSLSLSNSMTYTYGQETDTGVPMDHIPPFFGRAEISYKAKRLHVALYSMYNAWKRPNRYSPRDENNAFFATEDGWPAWMSINIRTSYALNPSLKLQLGIENILDTHYRPFSSRISAPGRNISLSLRANL
ncbi:MAG: TonB-dependent receptor [Bacteroidota bacterium]